MTPRRQLFEQMQQPRITNGHKKPNFWDGFAESEPDMLGKKLRLVAAAREKRELSFTSSSCERTLANDLY
jgi:hypothetical protein